MSEVGPPEVRTHARFHGSPRAGMGSMVDVDDITAFQQRSRGPAELAVHLRDVLGKRTDGVRDDIEEVDLGAHIGRFTVQYDRRGECPRRVVPASAPPLLGAFPRPATKSAEASAGAGPRVGP
jgi:hypothetical protein